jgi:hypothetical protein
VSVYGLDVYEATQPSPRTFRYRDGNPLPFLKVCSDGSRNRRRFETHTLEKMSLLLARFQAALTGERIVILWSTDFQSLTREEVRVLLDECEGKKIIVETLFVWRLFLYLELKGKQYSYEKRTEAVNDCRKQFEAEGIEEFVKKEIYKPGWSNLSTLHLLYVQEIGSKSVVEHDAIVMEKLNMKVFLTLLMKVSITLSHSDERIGLFFYDAFHRLNKGSCGNCHKKCVNLCARCLSQAYCSVDCQKKCHRLHSLCCFEYPLHFGCIQVVQDRAREKGLEDREILDDAMLVIATRVYLDV